MERYNNPIYYIVPLFWPHCIGSRVSCYPFYQQSCNAWQTHKAPFTYMRERIAGVCTKWTTTVVGIILLYWGPTVSFRRECRHYHHCAGGQLEPHVSGFSHGSRSIMRQAPNWKILRSCHLEMGNCFHPWGAQFVRDPAKWVNWKWTYQERVNRSQGTDLHTRQ